MDDNRQQLQDKWKTRAYMGVALISLCVLVGLSFYIFGILGQAVATVIVTALIAFMLHGTVNYLVARGLSRPLASLAAILIFLALIFGLIVPFIPAIAQQVVAFSAEAPNYIAGARDALAGWLAIIPLDQSITAAALDQASSFVQEQTGTVLQTLAGSIVSGLAGVGNGLLVFFIAVICAYWVLADLPTMSREVMSLFSDEQQANLRIVTGAFSNAVYGWGRATLICAIIVGVLNGIAFWVMGIPYFALLGALCGILYFIPYIGSIVSAVLVVLLGLLVSPLIAIIALAFNTIVHNAVANILSPKLMMSSVSVHPAVILIAILVGGALGGIVGMLFSIPVAAAVQGVFITFFEQRTGRTLATEDGALFQKPKVRYNPTLRKRPRKDQEEPADTTGTE